MRVRELFKGFGNPNALDQPVTVAPKVLDEPRLSGSKSPSQRDLGRLEARFCRVSFVAFGRVVIRIQKVVYRRWSRVFYGLFTIPAAFSATFFCDGLLA